MVENRERFGLKTEREHLSALYGLWVGLWSVLSFFGGAMLVLEILKVLVGGGVAIGGMLLYVILIFAIMQTKKWKIIYGLASAMVEMEIKSRARKKTQEEKGEDNG